jgi:hypothetical protein
VGLCRNALPRGYGSPQAFAFPWAEHLRGDDRHTRARSTQEARKRLAVSAVTDDAVHAFRMRHEAFERAAAAAKWMDVHMSLRVRQ